MNIRFTALAVALVLFCAWAPAAAEDDVRAMRCDVRGTLGYCYEYMGKGWNDKDANADCNSAPGGSFSYSSCPVSGAIGTCLTRKGGRGLKFQYYDPPFTRANAERACTGNYISR